MSSVFLVQAEHPFQSTIRTHIHASALTANQRAAELTNEILADFWEIYNEDEPQPEATITNWSKIVDDYGHVENFVQEETWGSWWVLVTELEIEP